MVAWTVQNIATNTEAIPERIFLMGHSAGGHTVAMLGMDETYLEKGGRQSGGDSGRHSRFRLPLMLRVSADPPTCRSYSDQRPTDREMWPLAFLDGKDPPILLISRENWIPLVQPRSGP